MKWQSIRSAAVMALLLARETQARLQMPVQILQKRVAEGRDYQHRRKVYYPKPATGLKTITSPSGATIRYKEPGKEGICETTPGVNSYSGFIDLSPTSHAFFWFFESRRDPANDDVTLWLNGGPGSDSLKGLFQELGPCNITANLTAMLNPYAWNEVSNMLFLSQPVGTGFSYATTEKGSHDKYTLAFLNASVAPPNGIWPHVDPFSIDSTDLAAISAWHILQAFYSALPTLDNKVESKTFNLMTESYGGHWGSAFFKYFNDHNNAIAKGKESGVQLNMKSLGIINGLIDAVIQAPYYPDFAMNNTYGIKLYNDTVYSHAKFTCDMYNGCVDSLEGCRGFRFNSFMDYVYCQSAVDICRVGVESMYYQYGERGIYDIRHPYDDPTPPSYFEDYLNIGSVQNAIGVSTNYTSENDDISAAFLAKGDWAMNFRLDIEMLLDAGIRVALYYGDADYIANWFGGEAVSLAMKYKHRKEFKAAGYEPLMVDGVEYGEVRQAGNFSFLRIYEAGHEIPYYQPKAALAMFNRTIEMLDIATGTKKLTKHYDTEGPADSTHTEPFPPLPSATGGSATGSAHGALGGAHRLQPWMINGVKRSVEESE